MSPKFSIVIPVYHVAPYLRECLDSVLAQTFTDWEAICVDDGSTDGSASILDEYQKRDSRFFVVHKSNGGVGSARNVGLEAVQGQWVWFVDADDILHPDALKWLTDAICLYPNATAVNFIHRYPTFEDRGHPVFRDIESADRSSIYLSTYCSSLFTGFHTGAWAACYRVDEILRLQLRFGSAKVGEDTEFAFRFLWSTNGWVLADQPLYYYRLRNSSAVHSRPSIASVRDYLYSEGVFFDLFQENAERWKLADCHEYFAWNRNFVWYTYCQMFFRLPCREQKRLLDDWIKLQRMQHAIYLEGWWRRFVLNVIVSTKSILLCDLLVVVPHRIYLAVFARLARLCVVWKEQGAVAVKRKIVQCLRRSVRHHE